MMMKIEITKKVSRLCVLAALAAPLSACGGFNGAEDALFGPRAAHPISVDSQVAVFELAAPRDKIALSVLDKAQLQTFFAHFRRRGHGSISVSSPSGSPNERTAVSLVAEIREELNKAALTGASVGYGSYRASMANSAAPILVTFLKFVATPSPCGNWSKSYENASANEPTQNLGCANQNNLAMLVADPADLSGTRPADAPSTARREKVLGLYSEGEISRTKWDIRDSNKISEVAN